MRTRGFTLLELMIVILIMGLLAAIALPAFTEMIVAQRVRDATFDLHATFMRARSESLTRNAAITVTPVSSNWALGWSMPDPANSGKSLVSHSAVSDVQIVGPSSVVFSPVGRLTNKVQIDLSSTKANPERCVTVELTGRARTKLCACTATC